ncbi:MAG: hypothetical protein SynsKO_35820 [Synoicihabitans sp.]
MKTVALGAMSFELHYVRFFSILRWVGLSLVGTTLAAAEAPTVESTAFSLVDRGGSFVGPQKSGRETATPNTGAASAALPGGSVTETIARINVHPTGVSAYEQIPNAALPTGGETAQVDLRSHFSFPGVEGMVVQFDTIVGKFAVELYPEEAPINVSTFLYNVNNELYTNSIIHRSVPDFVIQGGGYLAEPSLPAITPAFTASLEYNLPHYRGTLAMARASDPNSASTQWFINTVDNSEILKPLGEGLEGYTVIGRVLGSGLEVVDQLAALPVYVLSDFFQEFPLYDYVSGTTATLANLVTINSITEVPIYPSETEPVGLLTFTATSSNPSVVRPTIDASELTLTSASPGEAEITVRATESGGYWSEIRFDVIVLSNPPVVATHPVSQTVVRGTALELKVVLAELGEVSYEWMKDGEVLTLFSEYSGVRTDTLTITDFSADDVGSFAVRVTNSGGSTVSDAAAITIAEQLAAHTPFSPGYTPGQLFRIDNSLTFAGSPESASWSLLLPEGWTYQSSSGAAANLVPTAGDGGLLEWTWNAPTAPQLEFSYFLNVPEGATGAASFAGMVSLQRGEDGVQVMATPDPLMVPRFRHHSADTDSDFKFSLAELLRVIELYNTRSGSTRTGAYSLSESGVDGFATDPREPSEPITLARYHDADTDGDAKFSLGELLRVIELYNTRFGSTRTGQYKLRVGSIDGFDPDA